MIKETRLSPEMVDALEQAIREAVQELIAVYLHKLTLECKNPAPLTANFAVKQ